MANPSPRQRSDRAPNSTIVKTEPANSALFNRRIENLRGAEPAKPRAVTAPLIIRGSGHTAASTADPSRLAANQNIQPNPFSMPANTQPGRPTAWASPRFAQTPERQEQFQNRNYFESRSSAVPAMPATHSYSPPIYQHPVESPHVAAPAFSPHNGAPTPAIQQTHVAESQVVRSAPAAPAPAAAPAHQNSSSERRGR